MDVQLPERFLVGAWRNRRYTRSGSSFVLGLIPAAAMVVMFLPVQSHPSSYQSVATILTFFVLPTAWVAVNVLLFPFVRESWFRGTAPVREGMSGVFVSGPLLIVTMVGRGVVLCILWGVSFLVGPFALWLLGAEDRRGFGWRFD